MPTSEPPAVLTLLADPLRWQLVRELSWSDRRVGELVARVGKPQSLVSYHLAELRAAGLVSSRRSAADGRDVYYRAHLTSCRDRIGDAGAALHPGLGLAPTTASPTPAGRHGARPRLLFLCTGNSARSQMAEALAMRRSEGAVRASSAGSHPKPLHPEAVRVMASRGVDIASAEPKSLERFVGQRFSRVVTLCDKLREVCPDFGAATAVHWSIEDPAADADPSAFERVADEIDERVSLLLAELRTPA